MAPEEKRTFWAYGEGYDPTLLTLGSMALDYANPRQKRPYSHQKIDYKDESLVTGDERPICILSKTEGNVMSFDANIQQILNASHSKNGSAWSIVYGKDCTQVELRKPDEFFREIILNEPKALDWLRNVLSAANHLKATLKSFFEPPKIWVLTGVHLMNDAATYSMSHDSTETSASATVPVADPMTLSTLRLGAKVDFGRGLVGHAMSQIAGERVWAAQWRLIRANYLPSAPSAELLRNELYLLDIYSQPNVRRSAVARRVRVDLTDEDQHTNPSDGEGYDNETWKEFEKAMTEVEKELEED